VSDSSGAWHIGGIAPGRYRLRVRRIGYTAKDTVVVIGAEAPIKSDTIRIARAPVRLSRVTVEGERPSAYVTLMMSTVATVTLDAEGSLKDAHVAASSGSAPADAIVIASLRRAAAATDFPAVPVGSRQKSMTFDLVISMNEPPRGEETVVVGRVEAPVWASRFEASLDDNASQPDVLSETDLRESLGDTATLAFVVDAGGHPITSTARNADARPRPVGYHAHPFEARVLESLSRFHFTPARVGACPVPQLVTQGFGYSVKTMP
jgi:hypothetical protein